MKTNACVSVFKKVRKIMLKSVGILYNCPHPQIENFRMMKTTTGCRNDCLNYKFCPTVSEAAMWEAYIRGESDRNPRDDWDTTDLAQITTILQKRGYRVEQAIDGLEISKDGYAVGADIKASPDRADNGKDLTDFYVTSGNERIEGHIVTFKDGYPEDEEFYITEAVERAFEDEKAYRETPEYQQMMESI
jgi:hypothetical protein